MVMIILTVAAVVAAEIFIKKKLPKDAGAAPAALLGGRVEIKVCKNYGLVLGVLREHTAVVKALHASAVALCAALLLTCKRTSALWKLGVGLILGGGLSNLLDRLINGCVTDYIRFCKAKLRKLRRTVFNAADLCIFLGLILAVIAVLRKER